MFGCRRSSTSFINKFDFLATEDPVAKYLDAEDPVLSNGSYFWEQKVCEPNLKSRFISGSYLVTYLAYLLDPRKSEEMTFLPALPIFRESRFFLTNVDERKYQNNNTFQRGDRLEYNALEYIIYQIQT